MGYGGAEEKTERIMGRRPSFPAKIPFAGLTGVFGNETKSQLWVNNYFIKKIKLLGVTMLNSKFS